MPTNEQKAGYKRAYVKRHPERRRQTINEYAQRWRDNKKQRAIQILGPPVCAICGITSNLHVDHDHACCSSTYGCSKCIRGWLCANHNLGLGFFKDKVEDLEKMVLYLKSWKIRS